MSFVQTGGARLGRSFWWSINWTWPFATLEVDPEVLTLRVPGAVHKLPRANIRTVALWGPDWAPPGFSGIVVGHDLSHLPPYVLFWSFGRRALLGALEAAGYPIFR